MLSLALDTSGPLGSVALAGPGGPAGECALPVRADHSETLLPAIDRLLSGADRRAADLERVVVGAGPGSFTGVRIGASVAKGLCAATGAELLAFSSLAAIAAGTGCAGTVCAALDARRGQVYAAAYRSGEGFAAVWKPAALSLDALVERLRSEGAQDAGWAVAGSLSPEQRARLVEEGLRVLPAHLGAPRAAALLWLADAAPGSGSLADPAGWEPEYVRAPAAERERAR
ncbi:MAG: tRNA (adenosine(37)-N6)-threonylcarbamoyltransferase complex dimerization subunit type 1 TsaB [Gemmatimonadota bacterium]|nr:tRNA (adenosine(37)-N6)-threonylcarbamoyltransferase complex dimerization subunit type 1 TsaB [Gemmatimonadota bacterium]